MIKNNELIIELIKNTQNYMLIFFKYYTKLSLFYQHFCFNHVHFRNEYLKTQNRSVFFPKYYFLNIFVS